MLSKQIYIFCLGTRLDRALESLISMGPAILNGGITTFLALALLAISKSYAFVVFFKVFFASRSCFLVFY